MEAAEELGRAPQTLKCCLGKARWGGRPGVGGLGGSEQRGGARRH